MKTNKSYKKRLKVTKNGKVLSRGIGQNHYNAKESSKERLNKKRTKKVHMTNKAKSRFLNNV
jgi:ribosomal protein L35